MCFAVSYTHLDVYKRQAVTRTPKDRENLSMVGRTCAGVGSALIAMSVSYTHLDVYKRQLDMVDIHHRMLYRTHRDGQGAAHADLTVTFDGYKPLHIAESSAPLCGKIVCADIGIRDRCV